MKGLLAHARIYGENIMKRISTMLIGALLMMACSSDPTTRSAEEGAGVGAIAGGVICAVAHMNSNQCIAMMAGGAALGAAVGYSLAKDIQNRRQQLAQKENTLDARLAYVQGLNEDVAKFNRTLNQQIRDTQAKINEKQASQQQRAKTLENLDKQIDAAEKQIQVADDALVEMKQDRAKRTGRPSPELAQLDQDIDKYEQLLKQSKSDTQALASLRQRV